MRFYHYIAPENPIQTKASLAALSKIISMPVIDLVLLNEHDCH
jgi:hypothetical protein